MEMPCTNCEDLKQHPTPITRPASLLERPPPDPTTTSSRAFECRECGTRWLWHARRGWRPAQHHRS